MDKYEIDMMLHLNVEKAYMQFYAIIEAIENNEQKRAELLQESYSLKLRKMDCEEHIKTAEAKYEKFKVEGVTR